MGISSQEPGKPVPWNCGLSSRGSLTWSSCRCGSGTRDVAFLRDRFLPLAFSSKNPSRALGGSIWGGCYNWRAALGTGRVWPPCRPSGLLWSSKRLCGDNASTAYRPLFLTLKLAAQHLPRVFPQPSYSQPFRPSRHDFTVLPSEMIACWRATSGSATLGSA
jgi:hypothetical protein